jgi:hypothetical protein
MTKTVKKILADRPTARVIGINRRGEAMRIFIPAYLHKIEMTWNEDWQAWSARLAKGVYQQICVFTPIVEEVSE